jgi:hypothetical protein
MEVPNGQRYTFLKNARGLKACESWILSTSAIKIHVSDGKWVKSAFCKNVASAIKIQILALTQ